MEDSTACIHGSRGYAEPASAELRSEPWIIAAIAQATLPPNPRVDWDAWISDYGGSETRLNVPIRKCSSDFNKRMWQPGGFHRPLPARHREWKTKNGKANFIAPKTLTADVKTDPGEAIFSSSRPFAARANSTLRSIPTGTAFGAFTAHAWCCS